MTLQKSLLIIGATGDVGQGIVAVASARGWRDARGECGIFDERYAAASPVARNLF